MNVLLILASGKSSRFGGYPKAFCKINNEYVIQRSINLGKKYYDRIYAVISREIYPEYKDAAKDCKTLCIGTGQGDAHSFLRAARLIRKDCRADRMTLCWGDTFFMNGQIFKRAAAAEIKESSAGISLCSVDPKPYAWYETEGDTIKAARFRNTDGVIESGIHDQSVFIFTTAVILSQLESLMRYTGINDAKDYISREVSREMKLLHSFTYFYENNLLPMHYSLIETGNSYSFNTDGELENIKKMINARKKEAGICITQ